ncbi:Ger(x)C family spore germination protein [Paenibacillus sp. NPDC058174]|uniref:Ger(x)C family spore germination protein n=1 Tax=Paenibacillus sp. NPDC058174 TaxID=3346366 RepID=UPI0036D8859A
MRHIRRITRLLLVSLALACCTGLLSSCWSRHELNDISIVVGLGIDKKGEKYKVSAQIVNPSQVSLRQGGSRNFSPVVTYDATGATIPEALSRMTVKAARQLYFSHLRILIVGEEVAREGISKPLDFIARNREMRTDFYLIVAKNTTADKVLETYSPMDPIPSNNLFTKLETSDKLWAATGKITLDQLIEDLSKQGKNPSLTAIEIIGQKSRGDNYTDANYIDPTAVLKYAGMAAFKFDKMTGWLNETDTKVLNYLQNNITQTTGILECPNRDGLITFQIVSSHAAIHVNYKEGKPVFDVLLKTEQDVRDVGCEFDISKPDNLHLLEQLGNKRYEKLLENSIRKAQKELKVDIYGFGDVLHRAYPKKWRVIKDWNKTFENVEINVRALVTIRRIGTTVHSLQNETR